jgi:HEPN domain-containing protein
MQPSFLHDAEEWLETAERDLSAARRLLAGPTALTDSAVFHAQQAAEKALKGCLTAFGQPYLRTHELAR